MDKHAFIAETQHALAFAASCCLTAILAVGALAPCNRAFAEGLTATEVGNTQQFEIEALESAYKAAQTRTLEAKANIAVNQAEIDAIMRELPGQQERSDKAFRELYLMQSNRMRYFEVALGAETFDDFIKHMEYYDRASKANLDELNKLKDMRARLEEARKALDAAKAEADAQAEQARQALAIMQDQRAAKQQEGQTAALAQDGSGAIIDGADWHMTEDEFIAIWAPRIDAYFDGSPMAGTGTTFALMSFRYCVDPRWSPAISNTESSKGRACIRPHNAWGWGAADSDPYNLASEWSSWEQAIEAHIRGLANGYGYTISKSAAEKYCSSPDSWYANTLSEMAKI